MPFSLISTLFTTPVFTGNYRRHLPAGIYNANPVSYLISPLPVRDRGDFRFTLRPSVRPSVHPSIRPSVRPQIWIMRLLKKYSSYTSETSQLDRYQLGDNARHFFFMINQKMVAMETKQ